MGWKFPHGMGYICPGQPAAVVAGSGIDTFYALGTCQDLVSGRAVRSQCADAKIFSWKEKIRVFLHIKK